VDQILGQILRKAVWERLDLLDELASRADNGSLLSIARSELPRLTHAWRALLAAHAPDPRGRCTECSRRWRPLAAPCSVWRAAHEHLVSAEAGSSPAPVKASAVTKTTALQPAAPRFSLFRAKVPAGAGTTR
jgi:hypothetical protein